MDKLDIGLSILHGMGYGIYGWAIVINWGDIKSIILFVLAVLFGSYKLVDKHLDTVKKKLNLMILEER